MTDAGVLAQIVGAAQLKADESVLEIGPGAGALTDYLLAQKVKLTAVEIDRDLARGLKGRFGKDERFELVEEDVLKLDLDALLTGKSWKLVANLPYNISTPLFFRLVPARQHFSSMTIMVQKEVANRLLDRGTGKKLKDYGILSVVSALCFDTTLVCQVPPSAFAPPPKVDSTVIKLVPRPALGLDETELFKFVKVAYNQRRKLLLPRLKKELPEVYAKLDEATLEFLANKRPENLKPEDWLRLFQS